MPLLTAPSFRLFVLIALLFPGALAPSLFAQEAPVTLETLVAEATRKVYPALLYIEPVTEDFRAGRRQKRVSSGSGVIVSDDGTALTNFHVAGNARYLRCTLSNKEEVEASLVGGDPSTDVAVIRLDPEQFAKARPDDFESAPLGSSADLRVGQHVLAMGSPFGFDRSVSLGIVSCADRFLPGGATLPSGEATGDYNTWIQTDAAINPGNSGGPLVDLQGRVVGLNARVVNMGNSIGFAIPIDQVKEVAESIKQFGRVRRSWLGLSLQPTAELETELGKLEGVLIAGVAPGSPAARAGVTAGEVLLAVNGKQVTVRHMTELPAAVRTLASLPVGEPAELMLKPLLGEKGPRMVEAKTVEKVEILGRVLEAPDWGVTCKRLTAEMARKLVTPVRDGVMIFGVQPGSPAERAGLQAHDVLVAIESAPVAGLDAMVDLLVKMEAERPEEVALAYYRREGMRYALLRPSYSAAEATE